MAMGTFNFTVDNLMHFAWVVVLSIVIVSCIIRIIKDTVQDETGRELEDLEATVRDLRSMYYYLAGKVEALEAELAEKEDNGNEAAADEDIKQGRGGD